METIVGPSGPAPRIAILIPVLWLGVAPPRCGTLKAAAAMDVIEASISEAGTRFPSIPWPKMTGTPSVDGSYYRV